MLRLPTLGASMFIGSVVGGVGMSFNMVLAKGILVAIPSRNCQGRQLSLFRNEAEIGGKYHAEICSEHR